MAQFCCSILLSTYIRFLILLETKGIIYKDTNRFLGSLNKIQAFYEQNWGDIACPDCIVVKVSQCIDKIGYLSTYVFAIVLLIVCR